MEGAVHFLVPGDIATPTGGYGYDRRLAEGLRQLGFKIEPVALPDAFPAPDENALAETERRLSAIPDDRIAIIDGLAYGAMPAIAERQTRRLRLVALVHHPLADDGGMAPACRQALFESERRALAAARAVICTSATTARRLEEGFGVDAARIVVAPPGTERFPRSHAENAVPRILTVAAIVPRKGHDVLLEALGRLRRHAWIARFVGPVRDVAWAERLREAAERFGIADRIVFAGAVEDMAAEYRAADIFALATRHEGYGMAFAEAMAHGLAVVGCRVGAVPEVVGAGGVLVAPNDAAALAGALEPLITDLARREVAAKAAWRAAQDLPGWDECAARVAACLKGLTP